MKQLTGEIREAGDTCDLIAMRFKDTGSELIQIKRLQLEFEQLLRDSEAKQMKQYREILRRLPAEEPLVGNIRDELRNAIHVRNFGQSHPTVAYPSVQIATPIADHSPAVHRFALPAEATNPAADPSHLNVAVPSVTIAAPIANHSPAADPPALPVVAATSVATPPVTVKVASSTYPAAITSEVSTDTSMVNFDSKDLRCMDDFLPDQFPPTHFHADSPTLAPLGANLNFKASTNDNFVIPTHSPSSSSSHPNPPGLDISGDPKFMSLPPSKNTPLPTSPITVTVTHAHSVPAVNVQPPTPLNSQELMDAGLLPHKISSASMSSVAGIDANPNASAAPSKSLKPPSGSRMTRSRSQSTAPPSPADGKSKRKADDTGTTRAPKRRK